MKSIQFQLQMNKGVKFILSSKNNIYEELTHKVNNFETYFYWLKEGQKIIITKQNVQQYK